MKNGLIPLNVIEVIIENDLFGFEYRESMLKACPELQHIWDQAKTRLDDRVSNTLSDVSYRIASM